MNADTGNPAPEVHVQSLPWSLRHCGHHNALEDARALAAFLNEATTTERIDGMAPDDTNLGNWREVLGLCFRLLVDKLDIAAGIYKFPTLTHDNHAPRLCERTRGSHE